MNKTTNYTEKNSLTMFEFVKSEKLCDWNANETLIDSSIDSSEINPSIMEFVTTELNTVEESKAITKTERVKRNIKEPYTGKPKIPRRLKVCTTVPVTHFGPIPGIPVGTTWEKRIQVSEAGVHRPSVAGIHGRENCGAYSVVFSGTYAEDKDFGEEFFYSGCGGGVTDPKKFITGQAFDQTLTCRNKALAMNCNAPLNDEKGAEAEDWRAGKPIRVIRTDKLKKHSEYAPDKGNRYDGIYKVVKYFPVIGKCGLLVWRFLLRRDDPDPAPWTEEGKRAMAEKNLQIIRASKTDYVKKVYKCANSKNVKRLSKKSHQQIPIYPFPDEETFTKIISEALQATSGDQNEESRSVPNWSPTKSKPKKSSFQQSPKRTLKTKSKKSFAQNIKKKPNLSLKLNKIMDFASTYAESVNPDPNPLTFRGLLESPRKGQIEQQFNEFLDADLYACHPVFGMRTPQMEYPTFSTSNIEETDENAYSQTEAIEIAPDISFYEANTSLGKLDYNLQSNIPRLADHQPEKPASKLKIVVSSVKSLSGKKVAVPCITPRNRETSAIRNRITKAAEPLRCNNQNVRRSEESARKSNVEISSVKSMNCKNETVGGKTPKTTGKGRNAVRNRITSATEPLKIQNHIDLTTEEEDESNVLPAQVEKFIDSDTHNKAIWKYCRQLLHKSKSDFLDAVKLMFTCRYCDQLSANPVTTTCDHNACLECISNHFLKQKYTCPDCHNNLGPSFKIKENRNLGNALENLFPGYNLRY